MEEPKYLRHYLTRDPEGDGADEATGYVIACSKEHADANAGDLGMALTGEHRPHDDPRDECAICGWLDEDCQECNERGEEMNDAHTGRRVFATGRKEKRHRG